MPTVLDEKPYASMTILQLKAPTEFDNDEINRQYKLLKEDWDSRMLKGLELAIQARALVRSVSLPKKKNILADSVISKWFKEALIVGAGQMPSFKNFLATNVPEISALWEFNEDGSCKDDTLEHSIMNALDSWRLADMGHGTALSLDTEIPKFWKIRAEYIRSAFSFAKKMQEQADRELTLIRAERRSNSLSGKAAAAVYSFVRENSQTLSFLSLVAGTGALFYFASADWGMLGHSSAIKNVAFANLAAIVVGIGFVIAASIWNYRQKPIASAVPSVATQSQNNNAFLFWKRNPRIARAALLCVGISVPLGLGFLFLKPAAASLACCDMLGLLCAAIYLLYQTELRHYLLKAEFDAEEQARLPEV